MATVTDASVADRTDRTVGSVGMEGNEETGKKTDKRKKKKEKAYVPPTEDYADDGELYAEKYDDISRLKYWEFLIDHPRRKKLPKGFVGWTSQSQKNNFGAEILHYSSCSRALLAIGATPYWDYAYIYLLGLWIVLVVVYFDELCRLYILLPKTILLLPPVLMFLVQLIPTLLCMYIITQCNDLAKLVARETFSFWAFNAVMICQYLEYTYYGGHGRSHKAGKCRLEWEEDWENIDSSGNPKLRLKRRGIMAKLLGPAKVVPSRPTTAEQQDIVDTQESEEKDIEEGSIKPDGDSVDGDSVLSLGMEGGYLKRMREEALAAEQAAKQAALEEKARKEALIVNWLEWRCCVCGKQNRRPRHPEVDFGIAFSEKGLYYKRTIAKLVKERDMPRCEYCTAHADYKPRLCTAHLFPHYPKPHEAFENYPEAVPHIPRSMISTCFDKAISCLFGQRNHPDSRLMANDWRMSIYLSSRFPLVPRPIKLPHEIFELGEIVECRRQKSDWSRARIIESRATHIYDIKYDTGDDVRMVEENELRLPPGKGQYAYRAELCLALLVLFFPLGLFGAAGTAMPGVVMLPLLFIAGVLLLFRIVEFNDAFTEYYSAGFCIIFQQHSFVIMPLVMAIVSSLLALGQSYIGMPWTAIAVCMIVTKFISLPIMYVRRPTFAVMCFVLFCQTSICFLLVAIRLDGNGKSFIPWVMIDGFPALTSVYTLLRYRRWLGYVWDVSLKIRPLEYDYYENSYIRQAFDYIVGLIRNSESGVVPGEVAEEIASPVADETNTTDLQIA